MKNMPLKKFYCSKNKFIEKQIPQEIADTKNKYG
jgi:hypothetical protein